MTPDQLQWVLDHNPHIRGSHRVQIAAAVEAWRESEREQAKGAAINHDENWKTHAKHLEARLERALNQRDTLRALLRDARQAVAWVVANAPRGSKLPAAEALLVLIDEALGAKSHTVPVRDSGDA